ncbi:MAG: ISKra4 family transposase [Acidobacteria bacterium]|nr:ISKra4 family transposase [Acidobacteriota bacterium]
MLKLFQQRLAQGTSGSTEWIEQTLRAALLEDGRRLLEGLLAQGPAPVPSPQPGQRVYPGRRGEVVSLFGPLTLRRDYYHPPGPAGGFPLDQALGLIGGFTPGAARLLTRTAAQLPYLESSAQVRELAGLTVDPSQIQRLVQLLGPGAPAAAVPQFYVSVDGTGVPMVRPELTGRKGRGPDGQAKTREVKLAALFTQRTTDAEGHPVRDPDSTTYLGSFAASDDFGLAVRAAAVRRGLAQADTVIYLGDGAAWVWEVARTCFPQAVQILDYYHASEHVGALAKAVYADAGCAQNWAVRWRALLYDSELEVLLAEARATTDAPLSEAAQGELAYLERNRERMDYRRYRQAGWFIGSGVVEAGCKRVIGQRLKESGRFWTEAGATAVLSLRCALLSAHGWDQLWSQPWQQAA